MIDRMFARAALLTAGLLASGAALPAERVNNAVAEFTGIDKITGRIITFDVYINETVQFGALQVTPRVCYSAPQSEEPKNDSFVEVDEITLDRKIRRIFTGWMFAESPGLNAVEHAVYDVWLKSCKQKSDVPPPDTASVPAEPDAGEPAASEAKPEEAPGLGAGAELPAEGEAPSEGEAPADGTAEAPADQPEGAPQAN
jgi:hypothetical protein